MSEAATIFKTFTIEAAGQKYELRRPNLLTEGIYASYLEEFEAAGIKARREALGPDVFKEAVQAHLDRCVGNYFGWLRPGFTASLGSAKHIAMFLWAWISQCVDPKPKKEDVYEWYRLNKAAIDEVLKKVFSDPSPLPAE